MVKVYLNALKTKGKYTYTDISNLSGIPEATIKKIFSGETADPRFDTIQKLVTSMGGSMDNIIENPAEIEKIEKFETNVATTLKEVYEARVADLKEQIFSLKRDKRVLTIAAGLLMAFVIVLLLFDLSFGSHGWVQY